MADTRQIKSLIDGLSFTEGPRWHEGRLWFSDFYTSRVLAVGDDGQADTMAEVAEQPSGIGFLPDGDALIVSMRDRRILRRSADGSLSEHANLWDLAPWHLNDMVVDGQGRAWVGNFGYDLMGGAPLHTTNLIRVDPDGRAESVADGLAFPNGMVVTPDGSTLVVAESFGQCLTAFDISTNGSLDNRRVWASLGEDTGTTDVHEFMSRASFVPDGICLDAGGAIWAADALGQRAVRIAEGGEFLNQVNAGTGVFACTLGGSGGKTLFMCTAPSFAEDDRKNTRDAAILYTDVEVAHAGTP
jgi:sugar lactone lactonase YvrE